MNTENNQKLTCDASYFWSVCVLRRLRDMGLVSNDEYEKIRDISAQHYDTKIYAS